MFNLQSLTNLVQEPSSKQIKEYWDQRLKESDNIIRITRKIISNMDEKQKFEKAKAHIIDSLGYKHPRPESQSLETPSRFRFLYGLQSSWGWEWLLFLLGYVFMYLVIMDNDNYAAKIAVEGTILFIFWADTIIASYIKLFDSFRESKHSGLYWFRIALLALMTVDLVIFIVLPGYGERPIRPFRILRCFIPMLYDPEYRKSFFSLISAYTDIIVYLIFFSIVICGFALIGSRSLTFSSSFVDPNPNYVQNVDPYKNDITNLAHMIFVVYVTATYDSYPDNQILIIQNYEPNYVFFIVFIFLNMFLFSSIPGSLIYNKFRQTRSKILLVDEIRQQHSLILAFVTLAENSTNLSTEKLIKFLNYLYRYKFRYIEHITDICLKIDDNNNKSIQVFEFMQLSKIILENKVMTPPSFDDLEWWVRFRKFVNQNLKLKAIVSHWLFELIASALILLSFINALFFIYNYSNLVDIFDSIFVWIFVGELVLRIIGIGPESFFSDRWNDLDAFLVVSSVIFFFLNNDAGSIARMGRIFRLARLLKIIAHSNFMEGVQLRALDKLTKIFSVILEIMPIILKFMPLFMFFFYIFSIACMEIFYNSYPLQGPPAYSQYQQFSSFRTFIQSHYIMVQILTEAGWSMVAFDHSWKNPQYYGYVMVLFCLMHIIIVYIIATLIKGIFWEVFFTVNQIFEDREKETVMGQEGGKKLEEDSGDNRTQEYINPNTVLKRQIYENKLDSLIFHKLKQERDNARRTHKKLATSKKMIMSKIVEDCQISVDELDVSQNLKDKYLKPNSIDLEVERLEHSETSSRGRMALNEIEELTEEDFESEIDEIFHHVIINPKARYTHIIGSNKLFKEFLKHKLATPDSLIEEVGFDMSKHPIYNKESIQLHTYEMAAMLNIETSKREQKAAIVQGLRDQNIIDDNLKQKLIRKKLGEKVFKIDTNGTLRQLFLSDTNEELIRKFQVEYFSDLYGYSFKAINKITLEPLLKVEAKLTYTLRNILRYPQITNSNFFQLLTNLEDQFSNNLLKRGSLFKFIYRLDGPEEVWFTIEFKRQQDVRVHFIKTGVWCYSPDMENGKPYYARDIFKWDTWGRDDAQMCQKFAKRFYQSFEGLALSLLDQSKFFETNPQQFVYDLLIMTFDVEKVTRFLKEEFEISKIMVVLLSKEEERRDIGQEPLPYSLTDLELPEERKKTSLEFTFQDTENETYQKLKNLTAMDHERIVESEGLPFTYIVNLMQEVGDIIKLYDRNFIFHIEKVFNNQFHLMSRNIESKKEEENLNKDPLQISIKVIQ